MVATAVAVVIAVRPQRLPLLAALPEAWPVLLSVSSFPCPSPARGTPLAETNTDPGGVYARLAELGTRPTTSEKICYPACPSDDEILGLNPGKPVITNVHTACNDGNPVEVNEMTFDASAYVLRYDFDA